jgi:crotonobetainyl-CoA:carnitine CoA-transferase CaiB-like acyl-CoA transferase
VVNGDSAYFVWLNHGKESLVLDLKSTADLELIWSILAHADVFIQNLAPGATERLGLGSAELCGRFRRLIACDISGYGRGGTFQDMKAYDLLIQCEAGLAAITGSPAEPGRVGVSIADIACGVTAYSRILEALIEREATRVGAHIEVSLFDALSDWMNVPYLHQTYGGRAPARVGISHPSIAPYGAYLAGDGTTVVFGIQNNREFARFCAIVCEQPGLSSDSRFADNSARVENRKHLDLEISKVFKDLSQAEITKRLKTAAIAFGSLNSVEEFSRHPELKFLRVETDHGQIDLIAPAGHETTLQTRRVPGLGEHSALIRAEFAAG